MKSKNLGIVQLVLLIQWLYQWENYPKNSVHKTKKKYVEKLEVPAWDDLVKKQTNQTVMLIGHTEQSQVPNFSL